MARVTVVRLGNTAPMMQVPKRVSVEGVLEWQSVPAPHLDVSVTTVGMREGFDDEADVELALSTNNDRMLDMIGRLLGDEHRRYAIGVAEVESIMGTHSGAAPAWVAVDDDPEFEAALAEHFRCARGEPMALLTNAGRDALHAQHLSTSTQPASINYIALSANATAPSAASTTLPGEITTAGGGLLRAQATYAHTAGTNTSTLTKTFTANGSDSLPVTLAKIGVLNASTSGTLGYETLLNATATLSAVGDSVTITETVTAG